MPLPAIQNNNPGNIEASSISWVGATGTNGLYVVFSSPAWGFRALYKDIYNSINEGNNTLYQFFYNYLDVANGSHSEQDATDYANFVATYSGGAITDTLATDEATLKAMAHGIAYQESGSDADAFTESDYDNGYILFQGGQIASSPVSYVVIGIIGLGVFIFFNKKK